MVTDGVDGLLCAPGDVDDLERALRELYRPGGWRRCASGVGPSESAAWRDYLATLYALAGSELVG